MGHFLHFVCFGEVKNGKGELQGLGGTCAKRLVLSFTSFFPFCSGGAVGEKDLAKATGRKKKKASGEQKGKDLEKKHGNKVLQK